MQSLDNPNGKLVFQATWAAVIVASLLMFAKTLAWWLSTSLTIQASLLDSLSDFLGSIINFFAVRYSRKPANEEYRFGHGKAEALGGFVQSMLIMASTFWLVWHAFHQPNINQILSDNSIAIWVMAFSSALTLGLVIFQIYTIKKTNSIAVKADFLHYQADLLSNVVAIIALIAISHYGITWIDQIFGIGIAVFLIFGSWGILKQSASILMDKELEPQVRQDIISIIQSNKSIIDTHDLRTRSTGHQDFIQFHITLDPELSLKNAHVISDEVEETLRNAYPKSEIIIHLDPLGYNKSPKEIESTP